jgi:hypothetical protein
MGELSRLVDGAMGSTKGREAAKEVERRSGEVVQNLTTQIAQEVAVLPRLSEMRSERFTAASAGKARGAATAWLGDFGQHGPLQIESIRTAAEEDQYVTVVTYQAWEKAAVAQPAIVKLERQPEQAEITLTANAA